MHHARFMKSVKKAATLLVVASIAFTMFTSVSHKVNAAGTFETAEEAVSHMNVGWNLGNTFDAYGTWISGKDPASYETAWGNVATTKAMIDSVAAQGFNTLRLPVTWAQHIDDKGNIDEAWLNRVKEVVDYAYDNNMYVILNVHHDTGENGGDKVCWIMAENDNYSSNKEKFYGLWTNIATAFAEYDDHLLFEGYNEMLDKDNTWNAPNSEDSYQATNDYAQTFIDAVRATGGNNSSRNLIVNTYVSSFDPAVLDHFVVPTDTVSNHMICEVHCYSPWGFTGTSDAVNWTPVYDDFNDSSKTEIDGIMIALDNYSKKINLPIIIGEFGAQNKNNDSHIANYAAYFVSAAASKNIKCCYWDNGITGYGGYAIFDRAKMTWKTDIVSAMVNASVSVPDTTEETTATPTVTPAPTEVPTDTPTPEPTATPVPTVTPTPVEVEETTTTTSENTIASSEETTPETTDLASESSVSQEVSSDEESSPNNTPLFIVGGVILVAIIYTGLFVAGKIAGKHKNR